ncbi:patatin-like phospholipase family protein [Bradyrhizobium sp. Ash2021]|uniref:patatin-like phospholipase family protein n=1 Tax=Bradyrhizobium sp. Ash2021 TaxID=2954771 RepID=UPI002814B7AD|nr:patatin-like phospholipase family protein [Bradyrhizobium sp. Ash2021]WMT75393.1 patatin-like phospholipase family protein [Bradyrhizobium sp. Ash2021]
MAEFSADKPCRILSLDGGGAKGFYTLGVLREIEGLINCRIHERFDLIFGTSTGAIIAALLALGKTVKEISDLYEKHVPTIMQKKSAAGKSQALAALGKEIFGDVKFDKMKTGVGIVTTKWVIERPMIFKTSIEQAHGRLGTFFPGFGVTVSDAVQASCSAYPFFNRKTVKTEQGDIVELIDGGYCANNPTLYAIADAIMALKLPPEHIRVVSVGVGVYPAPKASWFSKTKWAQKLISVQLLQKTLEINTQSMDQLRHILFKHVPTVRVNDTFEQPEMATDLFEHNLTKLNILRQRGSESYAKHELELQKLLA